MTKILQQGLPILEVYQQRVRLAVFGRTDGKGVSYPTDMAHPFASAGRSAFRVTCHRSFIQPQLESCWVVRRLARVEQ
uniref:hypothetical protein n=1 Tax=Bradyrhizobium sp. SZCCHNS2096 TaxID=3057309 RepID=UPI0029170006